MRPQALGSLEDLGGLILDNPPPLLPRTGVKVQIRHCPRSQCLPPTEASKDVTWSKLLPLVGLSFLIYKMGMRLSPHYSAAVQIK